MIILGIIDGAHDSGAAVIKDGKIIAAVNEERLTRKKMQGGFPSLSIKEAIRVANISAGDIDLITFGSTHTPPWYMRCFRFLQKITPKNMGVFLNEVTPVNILGHLLRFTFKLTTKKPSKSKMEQLILRNIVRKDLPSDLRKKPIIFTEHHEAHTAAAYFCSGKDKVLCFSVDGEGDDVSAAVSICEDGKIKRIKSIGAFDSLGWFYGVITGYLGFTPGKHEGKIVGLAAFGKSNNVKIKFPFNNKGDSIKFEWKWGLRMIKHLKKLGPYKREDIAAWVQDGTEKVISRWAKQFIEKTKIYDIVLNGGVFSNVKLNQRIHEIERVKSVFVFPHMGDGGLAVGGALCAYANILNKEGKVFRSLRLHDVYLGPSYSDDLIKKELVKNKVKFVHCNNIEKEIAKLLADGKVVARFDNRMEFGPRALGARSVLADATDPTINDWLNKKFRRSEFMPFAPLTLKEQAAKCYNNLNGCEYTAEFMTITFDCTEFMKKKSPAAVHVDGTARPQLITKEINKSYYMILEEYYKITGIPSIINTSYNMHEEPIVCTPHDAIRAFEQADIDGLAIGHFLVLNQKLTKKKTNQKS